MRTSLTLLLALLLCAPAAEASGDGVLDTSFGNAGVRRPFFDVTGGKRDVLQAMAREPSGNYVLAGEVESTGGTGVDIGVVRIRASDGGTIASFHYDAFFSRVRALAVDGIARQVVVGIVPTNIDGQADLGVARFLGGAPDNTFAGDGALVFDSPNRTNSTDEPIAVVVRGDNDLYVLIREVPFNDPAPHPYTLVYIPDDGQAPTHLPLGATTAGYSGGAMLLQPDGKLVVAVNVSISGLCQRPRLFRFLPNSLVNLDAGFGGTGVVTLEPPASTGNCAPSVSSLALDAQGRLLLGATARSLSASASWVARVNTNGTLDSGFSSDGWTSIVRPAGGSFHDIYGIGVQPDGKIVTGGTFTFDNASIGDRPIISRLLSNGATDADFNGVGSYIYTPPGNANPQNGVALLMDRGRAVLAGSFLATTLPDYDFQVIRTVGPLLRDGFE